MLDLLKAFTNQNFLFVLVLIVVCTPLYREYVRTVRAKSHDYAARENSVIQAFTANSEAISKNTAIIASLQMTLERENFLKQQSLDGIVLKIDQLHEVVISTAKKVDGFFD